MRPKTNNMTVLKKKVQFSFWVFIALTILLVIFSVQNSGAIEVKLLFWKPNVSLSILLIGTFLTGLITGALYAYKRFLPEKGEYIEYKELPPEDKSKVEKDI
ncbi:hypothetical protein CDL62_13900 [Alkalitalea saponilacus]|uniref:Uncharacterized integral membrane protein n=2 Tax=Alkalitalea saponilacus TaxID=889453 RepID=A0A1T5F762_9BACT|nr:hypothetical protein CDL62_13900 [Alkalitalea saponilacus]SKB91983.1 Uncharacterized integral membrane protein [Alkalitalea saponilacus]